MTSRGVSTPTTARREHPMTSTHPKDSTMNDTTTTTVRESLEGYVWATGPAEAAYDLSRGYSYESVERAVEDNLQRCQDGRWLYFATAEIVDTEPKP